METTHNIRLTSSEISPIWSGYLTDSMANCVLRYFLSSVEDTEIKPIIEYAIGLTEEHIEFKNKLFQNEGFPIPHAFMDEDVNIHAPRLFSDGFMLRYLRQMGISGVGDYGIAIATSVRRDLSSTYLRLSAEIGTYADDCAGLMIKNQWMEKMPGAIERDALIKGE